MTCPSVFNVWPRTALLLPVWPRDATWLDTLVDGHCYRMICFKQPLTYLKEGVGQWEGWGEKERERERDPSCPLMVAVWKLVTPTSTLGLSSSSCHYLMRVLLRLVKADISCNTETQFTVFCVCMCVLNFFWFLEMIIQAGKIYSFRFIFINCQVTPIFFSTLHLFTFFLSDSHTNSCCFFLRQGL